jgi:large subunit ribosomal protein L32
MAVQKSRVSHSKTRMKRAHSALKLPTLSTDRVTGEIHLRHHGHRNKPIESTEK